jgi:uncharacterized membrane protein YhaH (DUF805 family)
MVGTAAAQRRRWHVANHDRSTVELAEESVLARIRNSELTKDTLVWTAGMAEWRPAGEVFSRYFAPPSLAGQDSAPPRPAHQSRSSRGNATAPGWRSFLLSSRGRISRSRFWLGHLLILFFLLAQSVGYWIVTSYAAASRPAVDPEGAFQEELGGLLLVGALTVAAGLFCLIPMFMIAIKRLHDRDKSGWWTLVFYVLPGILSGLGEGSEPAAGFFALAAAAIGIWGIVELGCLRGTIGSNRFGADPLARRG